MKRLSIVIFTMLLTLPAMYANRVIPGMKEYIGSAARPKSVAEPQYTTDGTAELHLVGGKRIVSRDLKSGKDGETVFDVETTRETKIKDIAGFEMSPDGSKMLVWRNVKKIYRRSFTAEYYVYELRSRLLKPLSADHQRQRSPLFSPDGRMVAFVADDNNIYLRKLDYDTQVAVTTDGAINAVINGVPDWVYEEEFGLTCAMTWSPDNLMLSYIKFNESDVPVFDFTMYEGSCHPKKQYALYPGSFSYKYPVAGEPNSVVSVCNYDVETRATKTFAAPAGVEYIPRLQYAYAPDRLMVVTLNRAQTRMEILSLNPRSLVSRSVLVEQEKAWLYTETYEQITWAPDGFVIFSGRNGYKNLYRYSYNGQLLGAITSGNYDVTEYYGYDPRTKRHFIQATPTGPINRVICSVDAKGVVKPLTPEQGYASAWFTPNMDFYTVNFSTATTPPVYTQYASAGDKCVRTLEDNAEYASRYASAPKREFFTFTTPEGVSLNGFMIKPNNFDASRRYPVIMHQYSGPASQQVLNRWSIDWMNFFANEGFIIVSVDGRGTGGRGRAFMEIVYRNLGHYETIDQSAAASYVASLPYVDAEKIAMWGWSYGGYETLMCLTTGSFKWACGVAVAPVTSWRYYDTIYAERYMLTPGENESGYNESAPMNHAANLDTPLLIMHGTADDNVHVSNTIEFVSALQAAGNYCDMLLFANDNHSIYYCNAREVLYSRLYNYFKTYLMD